jgi:rare lipoprotein A
MNLKILSGLATVSLLMATIGLAPSSRANPVTPSIAETAQIPTAAAPATSPTQGSVVSPSAEETKVGQVASTPSDAPIATQVPASDAAQESAAPAATASAEAVKVGEYQSQERVEESVAVMQSYESDGRQVATLYVRNIPVLSFLGAEGSAASAASPAAGTKVSSTDGGSAVSEITVSQPSSQSRPAAGSSTEDANDPIVRATAIAAQINQLHRNSIDASSIRAVWDESKKSYLIKVGEDTLTAIDPATILADTTNDTEQDALQATNRLRRLLGNASPLNQVEGAPRQATLVSVGPVQFTVSGYASWYGPGFNGNLSASGEVFNQNAMTAAHPNLPFGTQVRVTNIDNGLSVVVRINDRGPYVGDRLIDLSAGAADVIGLTNAGVAPVKLDVLGATGN